MTAAVMYVPEPATLPLLLAAVSLLAGARRLRSRRRAA